MDHNSWKNIVLLGKHKWFSIVKDCKILHIFHKTYKDCTHANRVLVAELDCLERVHNVVAFLELHLAELHFEISCEPFSTHLPQTKTRIIRSTELAIESYCLPPARTDHVVDINPQQFYLHIIAGDHVWFIPWESSCLSLICHFLLNARPASMMAST